MSTKWTKDLPAVLGGDDPIQNDAEILVYFDAFLSEDDTKQIARLAFHNDLDLSDEFVKRILDIAEGMRSVYANYPDGYVHVQVRFNLSYCNI